MLASFSTIVLCGQQRFEFSHPQMGTLFRLVIYGVDSSQVAHAAGLAFARIDSLNAHLSDYLRNSELNLLSAQAGNGKKIVVSEDLWTVLVLAKKVARKTKGAFDVSIGPLTKLWRSAFRRREFPEQKRIDAAKTSVNYRWIRLYSRHRAVRLRKTGMQLDLGGIAKGYALDEAMKILLAQGFHQVLLDGGGDLLLGAPPPDQAGWVVQYGANEKRVYLRHQAMATSGAEYRHLDWEGKRYAHIIDPRTGLGITEVSWTTVRANNAALADALASAAILLGKEKIGLLSRKFPAVEIDFFENK
ncbi:MAG: FAD:protein FMN transferase [Saprospiraceae bacterium]|nr:MAG: FAD:protein FMN transferase [Saprospiraceae bacterium]